MSLVADFGGTTVKQALVRDHGVIAGSRLAAQADRPFAERLEAVAAEWEFLLKKNGCTPRDSTGAARFGCEILAPQPSTHLIL